MRFNPPAKEAWILRPVHVALLSYFVLVRIVTIYTFATLRHRGLHEAQRTLGEVQGSTLYVTLTLVNVAWLTLLLLDCVADLGSRRASRFRSVAVHDRSGPVARSVVTFLAVALVVTWQVAMAKGAHTLTL